MPNLENLHNLSPDEMTRLIDEYERQLKGLNAYLTVSSMLIQSLDLHELLETTLFCIMDVVSSEAASILLLDADKENFTFYQVEGPAKPLLATRTFPISRGIAGDSLKNNISEIINDVPSDPRFYQAIDSESGFQTRNMIVVPLLAGKEPVGVLEVLNKAGGEQFVEEDRLLLISMAEQIAQAVRNAIVFDYLVSTYCKQRQGQGTCAGCKRPLGTWTPCTKYLASAS